MNSVSSSVKDCRICGSSNLDSAMDFGSLALTGVFLGSGKEVAKAPLEIGICGDCGLTQLLQNYDSDALYGASYGYESHLNNSMSTHLTSKARKLEQTFLRNVKDPVVVDVASNDGTLLGGYSENIQKLVGIDPLIANLSDKYPARSLKIPSFFSHEEYFNKVNQSAKLVTSLSVLYDLNDPVHFAKSIFQILDWEGIWHFEQSYLPTMLKTLSYDTICHEHLLYLTLNDIRNILTSSGFQLYSASLNSINGGSIAITAVKSKTKVNPDPFIEYLTNREQAFGYSSGKPLQEFASAANQHRIELRSLITQYRENDFSIFGLGASTKGNVLLQWLDLNSQIINSIGDINPKKFNMRTPGSDIPIIPESEILNAANDKSIALVLPWHFRESILAKSDGYFKQGGSMLFPLPEIQLVRF